MQSIPPAVSGQSLPSTFVFPAHGPLVNPSQQHSILYKQTAAFLFGIIQMVVGILCAIFNIVSLIVCSNIYGCNGPYICGYGIWCGVVFFISGSLGMFSGKGNPRKNLIIATMVMSIIAAVFSLVSFSLGIIDSATRARQNHHYSANNYVSGEGHNKYETREVLYQPGTLIAMGTLVIILSCIEAIAAITSSALCCKAVCCCCDNVSMTYMQVYNPTTQQTTYYSQAGYVPQYGPPMNNACPPSAIPTAPPQSFSQQQVQEGAVEVLPYDASDLPPPYSECLDERDEKKL